MTEHTALPWKARNEEVYATTDDGMLEMRIATGIAGEANARFIVTACNCHADLLEACKEAYRFFLVLNEIVQPEGMPEMVRILEQAIRKAEESQ